MAAINICNLSKETHRALRIRAARNGRSMEAEARAMLDETVKPVERLRMGSALVEMFRSSRGVGLDIKRDDSPSEHVSFET
jgi:plasmid stability protein